MIKVEIYTKEVSGEFISPSKAKTKKILKILIDPEDKMGFIKYNSYYSGCIGCSLDYLNNEVNKGNGIWSIVFINRKKIKQSKKAFKNFLKTLRRSLRKTYKDLYIPREKF